MLTTKDNPFNPYTHFDEWYQYDIMHGYHTCAKLGRITYTSPELSDADNAQAINDAIDEMLNYDFAGIYTIAYPPDSDKVFNTDRIVDMNKYPGGTQ